MIKILLLSIWLSPVDSTFGRFAQHQDSLLIQAYESLDTAHYRLLLDEFVGRYDKLGADEKKNFSGYYVNAWYNGCCTYARKGDKAMALDLFEKAIQAGFIDYDHILVDKDLETLRQEERFRKSVAGLRSVGDYMYIIRRAGDYNRRDKRALPVFTYAAPTDSNLRALKEAFHLDSIAGTGNEASQVINLLHWVHNLVPHDGNHENPAVRNAMAMIAVCKRDQRGLNCRGLATVLNECYLAMGFKSRFVTCLPKDSLKIDPDCHVINMVFLPSLKKWVWMDPTNDAYVMDETGNLLGPAEVRERLIAGKMLIVNPDANWNHRSSTLKEDYLFHYMAKNLYMLECPVNSTFDTEGSAPGKTLVYIRLLPLDYFKQSPDRSERSNYITYLTNNPDAFWANPQ